MALKKDTLLKVDERFIEAMSGLLDTNNPAGGDHRTRIQRNSMTDTSEGGGIQEYQGAFKLICEEVYPNPENPEEKKYILGVVNGQGYEAWRVQENDQEHASRDITYSNLVKCNEKNIPGFWIDQKVKPFYITINKLPEDTTFAAYFSFYYSTFGGTQRVDEPTLIIVERDNFRGFISKDGFSATLLGYFHWDSDEEKFTIEQIFGVNVNELNVSMPTKNLTCVNRTEFRNPKDLKDKTTINKIAVTNMRYDCFDNKGDDSILRFNFGHDEVIPYWESPELPLGENIFYVVAKYRVSQSPGYFPIFCELAIVDGEEYSRINGRKITVEEDGTFTTSGIVTIAFISRNNMDLYISNSIDSEMQKLGSILIFDVVP